MHWAHTFCCKDVGLQDEENGRETRKSGVESSRVESRIREVYFVGGLTAWSMERKRALAMRLSAVNKTCALSPSWMD